MNTALKPIDDTNGRPCRMQTQRSASRRAWSLAWGFGVIVAAVMSSLPSARAAVVHEPALTTPASKLAAAMHCPRARVQTQHEPVLLVHGTGMTAEDAWSWGYAEALRATGYYVCTVDLPSHALIDLQVSAEYVAHAIRKIHYATGARVDVVGHSQGNLEIRWVLKWWPKIRAVVDDAVLLASPSHGGISATALCSLGTCSPPAWQMRPGSRFVAALNRGDETPGAVSYTSIYTASDEIVQPWTSARMEGAANLLVQRVCPGRVVTHGGLLYDAVAFRLTVDALANPGPGNLRRLPASGCLQLLAPKVTLLDLATYNAVTGPAVVMRLVLAPHSAKEPALKRYAAG